MTDDERFDRLASAIERVAVVSMVSSRVRIFLLPL